MSRLAVAAGLVLLLAANGDAQTQIDPPLAGRPANFSHLIGRFGIATHVAPSEGLVEDPLTLRVVIMGDVAAGEPPARKSLRLLTDDFEKAFYVEAVPENDKPSPEQMTWEFVWKLRPKSTDVREVPSLALAYYSPQIRRYQTARSEPIPLSIRARPKVVVELQTPATPPASFLELADWSAQHGARGAFGYGPIEWIVLALAVSWLFGGVLARRAAVVAHGSQAGAIALGALQSNLTDPAPIVATYWKSRLGFETAEPTPRDIDRMLQRNGVAPDLRRRWTNWYRAVAERRFAAVALEQSFAGNECEAAAALIVATESMK